MSARHLIEDRLYRYSWAIDAGDADGVAECFTIDAEMTSPGGTKRGREAIRSDTAAQREARAARGIVRHLTTNVTIDGETAESASVRSIFLVSARNPEGLTVMAAGWYEDDLVREGDSWLISRRVTHVDGA
jgi:uncharacterized protein (TIGR02246 family)